MTSRPPTLELRTPNTTWMLGGVLATICLFGGLWFLLSFLVSLDQPDTQNRVIMIYGLSWMVCAVVWWKMRVPQSRLHAVFSVLLCTLLAAFAGTLFRFVGLLFQGVLFDRQVLVRFSAYSVLLLIVQLILAIPSAFVMQQIVLRRTARAPYLAS